MKKLEQDQKNKIKCAPCRSCPMKRNDKVKSILQKKRINWHIKHSCRKWRSSYRYIVCKIKGWLSFESLFWYSESIRISKQGTQDCTLPIAQVCSRSIFTHAKLKTLKSTTDSTCNMQYKTCTNSANTWKKHLAASSAVKLSGTVYQFSGH